jgi:hypothetical protein
VTSQAAAAALASFRDRIERPIFIVSNPRSGSTLLFETLAQAPDLYTVGGESHLLIEGIPALAPAAHGWASNRLTADDAKAAPVEQLAGIFYNELRDRDGRRADGPVRMLEKTPKNALRVPFFDSAWPDATFVYLYRDARQTLSSMIEAWRSGRFRTYPQLPGWTGVPWSLLLTPGWEELNGLPPREIVARQWATTTELLLDDLAKLPRERVRAIDYGEFLKAPQAAMESLAASIDLGWDRPLAQELPLSAYTVSRPNADKWRANEAIIEQIWPLVEKADARARAFVESFQ